MTRHVAAGPLPRVILIGGAPASGKTSAARAVARLLDRPVVSTDDLGEAVRAMVPRDALGDLHAHVAADTAAYYASHAPDALVDLAIRAHRALWPAIGAVARAHAAWAGPAVVEGWAITPGAARGLPRESVGAVFIGVSEAAIATRVRADTGFLAGSPHRDRALAHFIARSVAFTGWLRAEAAGAGAPFLDLAGSEPADEVACRCLAALGGR